MSFGLRFLSEGANPVSLADFKVHARIEFDDEDAILQQYLDTALKQAEKVCRRLFRVAQVKFTLHAFDNPVILKDVGEVISVDQIQYINNELILTTLPVESYRVVDLVPAQIYPASGLCFPRTSEPYSVFITATVGSSVVPTEVKQWILLKATELFEMREASGQVEAKAHSFVDHLIEPYRVL